MISDHVKKDLQRKAIQVAVFEHRDDPQIKKIQSNLDALKKEADALRKQDGELRQKINAEAKALQEYAMPFILEELRD
jgi:uncharacterized coiled-coil DUF342 family protein